MNECWNLNPIYTGFDDPRFEEDLQALRRTVLCAAPIIAAGDVTGVVALLTEDRTATPDAAQLKAVNVAAAFLARQMEE